MLHELALAGQHAFEHLVLGSHLVEHFVGYALKLAQHFFRQYLSLHTLLFVIAQGGRLRPFTFGEALERGGLAAHLDQRTALRLQLVPDTLVNQQMRSGQRLVPARHDVVLDDLIQAQQLVDGRLRELGGVDGLAFQRLVNLAARHHGHRGTELLKDLAADAGKADAQAIEVFQLLDGVGEPAGAFRADDAAQHRVNIALGVDLFEQLFAVTFVVPGQIGRRLQSERRTGIQWQGGDGALVVADPGIAGRVFAVPDRVHDLKGRHQLAGLVVAQLDIATGNGLEGVRKVFDRGGQADQVGRKGERDLPANLFRCGCVGADQAGTQDGGRTDGAGKAGKLFCYQHCEFLNFVFVLVSGNVADLCGGRLSSAARSLAVLSAPASGIGYVAGSVPDSGSRLY